MKLMIIDFKFHCTLIISIEADRGLNINSTINMQSDSAEKAPEKVCYICELYWGSGGVDGRQ